jgi:protein-S-isoprenylcysteine O-methyltransferase Ste14
MNNKDVKSNILIRGILREFIALIIGAIFLFTSAGTFYWGRAWIYISIAFIYQVIYITILMFIIYPIISYSSLIVAGMDVVRYKWSNIPFITIYPGLLLFILSSSLALWAYANNSHFILTHRNDKISNQQVCTTGPYRYIRHPGYFAAIISTFCYPFIIGSLFSLIPVFFNIVLLIIRTYYEDKTLKIELNGYTEYSGMTKYKLFPYLW